MEATLEKVTESTARAIAGEKQLERRLAETRANADRWKGRALQAVKSGDEPAAGIALARRFELEKGAAALAAQLARCHDSNGRLRRQLDQLRDRLTAAKGEMGVLIVRQRSAEAQRQFAKTEAFAGPDSNRSSISTNSRCVWPMPKQRPRRLASCASTGRRRPRRITTSNANCSRSKRNVPHSASKSILTRRVARPREGL